MYFFTFHLTFLWNKKVKWNLTGSFQDFKSPLVIWSKLNLLLKRLAFFDLSFLLTFATRNQPVIGIDCTKRKASSTYLGMIPSTWCYDKHIVRPSYYYLYLYSTQWSNLKIRRINRLSLNFYSVNASQKIWPIICFGK